MDTKIFLFDSYPIKTTSITDAGFLRFIAPIAKVGKFPYINKKSGKLEYQVVTSKCLIDSAESFKQLPLTSPHPPVNLTPDNASQYTKGSTGHGYVFDGSFLWFTGTAFDRQVIDGIKSKKCNQLSCGYEAYLKQINGDTREQVKRVGNHLATVELGRHGEDISINYDSVDSELDYFYSSDIVDESDLPESPEQLIEIITRDAVDRPKYFTQVKDKNIKGNRKMVHVILNSKVYNIDGDDASALRDDLIKYENDTKSVQTNLDSKSSEAAAKDTEIADLKAKLATTEGQLDSVKAELEESKKKTVDVDIDKEIKDRLEVWNKVLPHIRKKDSQFNMDATLSIPEIKVQYLKTKYPNLVSKLESLNLNDSGDLYYINGMYDSAISAETTESEKQPSVTDSVFDLMFSSNEIESNNDNQTVDYRKRMAEEINNGLTAKKK